MVYDRKMCIINRCFIIDENVSIFNNIIRTAKVDVIYLDTMIDCDCAIVPGTTKYKSFTYIHNLDMFKSEYDLYKLFNKNIRNSINWCLNNNVTSKLYDYKTIDSKIINDFISVCKKTYRAKGLSAKINKRLLINYANNKNLVISKAYINEDNVVYHVYKVSDERAILWYSCSLHRYSSVSKSIIGKENRFLHYEDLLFFKKMGLHYYDWGGLSKTNQLDSIASFKKSFEGGNECWVYSYKHLKSKKAKLLKNYI